MSYSDDDEFGPEPAWVDGYTGGQEAKEDHLASLPPLMPGGESTSAQLRRVRQERDELSAALDRANDDVTDALAERDKACTANARLIDEMADVQAAAEEKVRAVILAAGDELMIRAIPTSKEKTMPATNDDGPVTDPMINAAAEALWPHLPGEVQDGYELYRVRPWVAASAAAALRVMADEIDRGPTFPPPSVISALVRERANRLTDVPDRGAR